MRNGRIVTPAAVPILLTNSQLITSRDQSYMLSNIMLHTVHELHREKDHVTVMPNEFACKRCHGQGGIAFVAVGDEMLS